MHTSELPQQTQEAIVSTAISMDDTLGIDKLSIRNLGVEVGVEAMNLYYPVPNKAQLLLEMTNRIISNMHDAQHDQPWRESCTRPCDRHSISSTPTLGRSAN